MPELASIPRQGVQLPAFRATPALSPFSLKDPLASTEAESTTLAMATLAESLAKLPEAIAGAYDQGKREGLTRQAEEAIGQRLKSGDLTDLTIETGPKGTSVQLNKQDPYAELRAMVAAQGLRDKQAGPARYHAAVAAASEPTLPSPSPAATGGGGLRPRGPLSDMADDAAALAPTGPMGTMAAMGLNAADEATKPIVNPGESSAAPMAEGSQLSDPLNQDPIAVAAKEKGGLAAMGEEPETWTDPVTGLLYRKDKLGNTVVMEPDGSTKIIEKRDKDSDEGKFFASEAEANTYAETNNYQAPKVSHKDGKVWVKEFVPKDTDEKGKLKLTDSTRKELSSAKTLMDDLDGLEATQERLYNEGKSGPVAGRWEQFKAKLGFGDADYVGAAGKIVVGQFKIARLLNGPGVLTDKDIQRAQAVAPTLNETPASFKAKMKTVREMLRTSVETWMKINGSGATPDQKALAEGAIRALGGTVEGSALPASGAAMPQGGATIEAIQQRRALLERGVKADGSPLSPQEKAALKLLLDQLERKAGGTVPAAKFRTATGGAVMG